MSRIGNGRRFRIFMRDGFACVYCGRRPPEITLEVDHRQPRSKGGGDDDANLVTACLDCNRGKRDKQLAERPPEYRPSIRKPLSRAEHAMRMVFLRTVDPAVWVLRAAKTKTCEDCGQPERIFHRGQVIGRDGDFALVQWQEWMFGEDREQSLVAIRQMADEGWCLYSSEDDFHAACRGVLKAHDHDGLYDFRQFAGDDHPRIIPVR